MEGRVNGLPADEIFVYEDALKKGRSVLFVESSEQHPSKQLRQMLKRAGAESIDVAREAWWIGLRSAEKEHYQVSGGNFERDESAYRAGFEAAVHQKDPNLVREAIAKYGAGAEQEAFRTGHERGRAYRAGTAHSQIPKTLESDEQVRNADEAIDEASEESFPASDPPSH
jgi:superfamily II DNA/RNA helicase